MTIPINAADFIVIILFCLSGIFLYYGIQLEHTGYLLISVVEFIMGLAQFGLNKHPVIFEKNIR